jgi:hypothetical protein
MASGTWPEPGETPPGGKLGKQGADMPGTGWRSFRDQLAHFQGSVRLARPASGESDR